MNLMFGSYEQQMPDVWEHQLSDSSERKQEPIIFMTLAPAFYNDQNDSLLLVNVFSLKLMHMSSQQINGLLVFCFLFRFL